MPYKDPEKDKEHNRDYYQKHKEEKKKQNKVYYQAHREKIIKQTAIYGQKWRDRTKLEVLEHYSNGTAKCAYCGTDDIDILCIDHINGSGNKHRQSIGTNLFHRWLRKNNYPEGYQVLCRNCNWKKEVLRRRKNRECHDV